MSINDISVIELIEYIALIKIPLTQRIQKQVSWLPSPKEAYRYSYLANISVPTKFPSFSRKIQKKFASKTENVVSRYASEGRISLVCFVVVMSNFDRCGKSWGRETRQKNPWVMVVKWGIVFLDWYETFFIFFWYLAELNCAPSANTGFILVTELGL